MKFKFLGFSTFKIEYAGLTIITDPQALYAVGLKLPSSKVDVVLNSMLDFPNKSSADGGKGSWVAKLQPHHRDEIMYLANYGEYELGDVTIRRNYPSGFFVIDDKKVRVVYCGLQCKELKSEYYKNLGKVDVLMLPVGDGEKYPSYKALEKMISSVEPRYLLPYAYQDKESKELSVLQSIDVFVSELGIVKANGDKVLRVMATSGDDSEQSVELVVLQKS